MPATIHGEITDDRSTLILLAVGPAEDIAYAAGLLAMMTPLGSKSDPPGAVMMPLTWPAVVQCSYVFGQRWVPSPDLQDWCFREVLNRTGEHDTRYTPPPGLEARHYQLTGAAMIGATGKGLILDEPGTGKTITAILGVNEWAVRTGKRLPVLVICPASVVDSWVREFGKWAPHLHAVAWRGPNRNRWFGRADVYVTSYETARRDAPEARQGPLSKLAYGGTKAQPITPLGVVIVDEFHRAKTRESQNSRVVRRLCKRAAVTVGLSGTPITHHTGNLWTMLCAMWPGAYPSGDRFDNRYLLSNGESGYDEKIIGLSPHTEPEFRMSLAGTMRRVAKADVLTELPPKIYSQRIVRLPGEWRKVYDDFAHQMLAELPDGTELSVMDTLTKLNHLSRLACAPADVEYETAMELDRRVTSPTYGETIERTHVHLHMKHTSWKVTALLEVLAEREDQSVLVFAPSRQLIVLAGEAAAKAGRRVGYVYGGQTARERTRTVDAFEAGELDVVCATTGAGGVGLTLNAASTEVFLQRPFALVDAIQAEDRAHRIGQQADVLEIIDVIAHDTLDERIREVLWERGGALAELLQDPRIVTELLGGQPGGHAQSRTYKPAPVQRPDYSQLVAQPA